MQTIEQQKDKRNSGSFIKNLANNENNNVSNGRESSDVMGI